MVPTLTGELIQETGGARAAGGGLGYLGDIYLCTPPPTHAEVYQGMGEVERSNFLLK